MVGILGAPPGPRERAERSTAAQETRLAAPTAAEAGHYECCSIRMSCSLESSRQLGVRPDVHPKWEVGQLMVTLVRRLFGVRAYDNRSYQINSCHIAKVLRNVPSRPGSLNQQAPKRDSGHEADARQ